MIVDVIDITRRRRTAFMIVRVLGLVVALYALGQFSAQLGGLMYLLNVAPRIGPAGIAQNPQLAWSHLAQVLAPTPLLFASATVWWLAAPLSRRLVPVHTPQCPRCLYSLESVSLPRCPECGIDLPPEMTERRPSPAPSERPPPSA